MNPETAVIIMGILALGALIIQAIQGHKLNAEFAQLRYLAQWAIEHCPPPADITRHQVGEGVYVTGPAIPGQVKFHFPSVLFPERPDPSGATLT